MPPHDPAEPAKVALIVDLDRTLTRADVAVESLVRLMRRSPMLFWQLLLALLWGRAALKTRLARLDPVDPALLPLRAEVVDLIGEARRDGRPVILASAAHRRNVGRVARHLGLFDRYLGSSRRRNLKSAGKLRAIRAAIGDAPFDYVGDSTADRAIWREARHAYTVGVPTRSANEQRVGPPPRSPFRALVKAIRPHQWAKNALVFVPLATSGHILDFVALGQAALAFVSLSVIASSVYLLNDLLDIDADRRHTRKRSRPLAAGDLGIPLALAISGAAAILGLAIGWFLLGPATFAALAAYFALTLAYSFRLKSAMIADVLALASLYTIRMIVGAAAIAVAPSMWLLIFSIFFFLSLGYLKRYVELDESRNERHQLLSGRGYVPSDKMFVAMGGVASGMVSLLVLLLFAAEKGEGGEYAHPALLWLLVIPLLYWLNRIWMMAGRGQVDGDPVAFALRDRRSIVVGARLAVIVVAAKYGG